MSTLRYAWRGMRSRSAYTLLALVAIAVALSSAVAMQALGAGLTNGIRVDATTFTDGDVVAVWPVDPPQPLAREAMLARARAAGLVDATSATLVERGTVQTGDGRASQVVVRTVGGTFPLHPEIFAGSDGDPETALARGDAVVTEATARRLHLAVGDALVATGRGAPPVTQTVNVGAITTLTRAVEGDEAFFGTVFLRSPDPGLVANELRFESSKPEALVQFLSVEAPAARLQTAAKTVQDTLDSISQFTEAMVLLSVGTILLTGIAVGSTSELEVVRRRRELGILRGIGLTRSRIVLLFVLHMGFLGLLGGVLGSVLGVGLARVMFTSAASLLSLPVTVFTVDWRPVVAAPVVGALVAALFTVAASLREERSSAWTQLRNAPGDRPGWPIRLIGPAWTLVAMIALTIAVTGSVAELQFPVFFLLFIWALQGLVQVGLRVLGRLATGRVTSKLVLRNLADPANKNERVVGLASVCVLLATVGILLGTNVKDSMKVTASRSLGWDVLVTATTADTAAQDATQAGRNGVTSARQVPTAKAKLVAVNGAPAQDAVAQVLKHSGAAQELLEGGVFDVQGIDPATDQPPELSAGQPVATEAGVVLAAPVAEALGLQLGDTVQLAFTSGGAATLSVVGLERRQAVTGHTALMQAGALAALAPHDGVSIFARSADPDKTAEQIRQQAPGAVVYSATEVLSSAEKLLNGLQAFITIALAISCAAAALVMASTIATSVLSRRTQVGILRSLGCTRARSVRMLVTEQAVGNAIGAAIGMAVGVAAYVVVASLAGLAAVLSAGLLAAIGLGVGLLLVGVGSAAALPAVTVPPAAVLRYE